MKNTSAMNVPISHTQKQFWKDMFNQFMKQQIISVINATTTQQQKKISMSIYRTLIKMQMAQKPLAIEAEKKKGIC